MARSRWIHALVVRRGHGYMLCEPQVRVTGYAPIAVSPDPDVVTCPRCQSQTVAESATVRDRHA